MPTVIKTYKTIVNFAIIIYGYFAIVFRITEIFMERLNMISEKNSIVDEIKETIEKIFSVRVTEYVEINKGLLNLKWKFVTDNRTLFVKQYNSERYPGFKRKSFK